MPRKTKRLLVHFTLIVFFLLFSFIFSSPLDRLQTAFVSSTPTPTKDSHVQGDETAVTDIFTVVKVVDGDTITVKKDGRKETVRLIGINTPETVDPRKSVECFGKEASNKTKSLLSGKQVKLESDETQINRDKYNRILRYVYLPNGTFINLLLVQEGYAYEYTYDVPYIYQQAFKTAQSEAERQGKGLWSPAACGVD